MFLSLPLPLVRWISKLTLLFFCLLHMGRWWQVKQHLNLHYSCHQFGCNLVSAYWQSVRGSFWGSIRLRSLFLVYLCIPFDLVFPPQFLFDASFSIFVFAHMTSCAFLLKVKVVGLEINSSFSSCNLGNI